MDDVEFNRPDLLLKDSLVSFRRCASPLMVVIAVNYVINVGEPRKEKRPNGIHDTGFEAVHSTFSSPIEVNDFVKLHRDDIHFIEVNKPMLSCIIYCF
jgi:hypothetical protein